MTPLNIAVLCGGLSQERRVSLMSGEAILNSLLKQGHQAMMFDTAKEPIWALENKNLDVAFIALHGGQGENGTIQAALDILKIPYTGSGLMASAMAMNKPITKQIWQTQCIPTPDFVVLDQHMPSDEKRHLVIEKLGLPAFIKPIDEGSSLGVKRIKHIDEFDSAMDEAQSFHRPMIAEQLIQGREMTCIILNSTTLPIIEIIAPKGDYNYQNKYFNDSVQYVCPASVDETCTKKIKDVSLQAYQALGCRGWARVDLILQSDHSFSLLEINTSPGMTSHSLVPTAAKAAGISFEELVATIIKGARHDG